MSQIGPTKEPKPAAPVDLTEALATLRANQSVLEEIGVMHEGIFGSVARGEAGADSDIDIVVVLDHAKVRSIYDLAGVWRTLTDLFGVSVDVVERDALRERMKDRVETDMVNAF
jgi:predicted nucleotidyltransferase